MTEEAWMPAESAVPSLTIGVIGTGNMGSALVRGWAGLSLPGIRILVWDKVPEAVERVADCEGVVAALSVEELIDEAALVLLVVKPKDAAELLTSLAPLFHQGQLIISAMAGVDLEQIRRLCGPSPTLIRVMPNLGVEVGAGTVAVAAEPGVSAETVRGVIELFAPLGLAASVPESMMDAVTAVSGTGPALLALALEGLEDGGVAAGLPRATARVFARRAMLGISRMMTSGDEPASFFVERLAAPGDPLYEGVEVLEERGVRSAFQEAVAAASERARQMHAH